MEKQETPTTYRITLKCINCRHIQLEEVPKGTMISNVIDKIQCDVCGCSALVVPF